MFNTTENYNKTVVSSHVNAVSGNITKTYRKSWFERFHLNSNNSKNYLDAKPIRVEKDGNDCYGNPKYKNIEIVVVQLVVVGDMEVVAEIMYKEDYENIFENLEEENE